MNYQEAAEIAKRNPGSILTRDESGGFCVRGADGRSIGESVEIPANLAQELKERESKIAELKEELSVLKRDMNAVVESRITQRKESLEAELSRVKSLKIHLQTQCDQTETKLRKLALLEKAYAERFGAAAIREVAVSVENRDVCPRCGGDGGVNGGCGKCDGTGWYISQVETIQEEVQFK